MLFDTCKAKSRTHCKIILFQGTSAWRDSLAGSWFIQELIQVFQKYAEHEPLAKLRQKINLSISRKSAMVKPGEIAKMMSDGGLLTLTKDLYFNPGRSYEAWWNGT